MVGRTDQEFVRISVENQRLFEDALKKASEKIDDLSWPLNRIVDDFHRSEKAIFKLKSKGAYKFDLDPRYKKYKLKRFGFIYPMLKATGALERSVTSRNAKGSVVRVGKKFAFVGTSVQSEDGFFYPGLHQSGGRFIPQRMFLFIGPESSSFHEKDRMNQGGRVTRWTKIVEGYADRVLQGA